MEQNSAPVGILHFHEDKRGAMKTASTEFSLRVASSECLQTWTPHSSSKTLPFHQLRPTYVLFFSPWKLISFTLKVPGRWGRLNHDYQSFGAVRAANIVPAFSQRGRGTQSQSPVSTLALLRYCIMRTQASHKRRLKPEAWKINGSSSPINVPAP